MLVNLNDVLLPAKKAGYGVGLFNTLNSEMAKGVLRAAERNQSPVIIGTAEVLLPHASLEEIAELLLPMAKRATVPVVLHFDHGLTEEACYKALDLGFTSIMYDCSTEDYETNLRKVKEMAKIAHDRGATIEAELGHVGQADGDDPSAFYTDPRQAKEFVEYTEADALAIAVGTAHGAYKFPPKLDFERIETIASLIPTPLVLHGGSGLTDEDFREAIRRGISKINIFTDINIAYAKAAEKALQNGALCATDMMEQLVEGVAAETEKKMKLFLMK
ncbi:class II fructose-bisphosphate aldolase [Anaerotignum lactatifermentans]|uniref:Class II fructose-bisphosphate aldolase n=1 Tax=Anaerotignum lactatifermentans TaxID=160404 RepID=A0ABS2G8A0_9FIRM|nr:class II fructose-bisphosphate aldolase [Anaerotignum lactatifermentans]MBM6828834.1 class II fructose-bisphosphate aldolase [Anaerotignum lactatifermentans]MBM6876993.1 class II fructose-bisphosphate aldolase [Anaerotignum lactatifermentans]MBM6950551.1 class II fructose-bisphosphate aldolase [Anaerotignum lactatifermentans]